MSKDADKVYYTGLAIAQPSPVSRGQPSGGAREVHQTGLAIIQPPTVSRGQASGGARGNYENKSQVTYNHKQTGSYVRATATEKATAGDFYWKNGTSGTRSEYKQTETVRVGDKGGYTEVYNEQRVRDVTYSNNHGSKNLVTYDNKPQGGSYGGSGGGSYGGYDYDSDY